MAIKCKICGNEFEPVIDKHYVTRDLDRTGFVTVFSKDEVMLYDTFDCPVCGCQNTVQERKRTWFENQFEDDDDEVEEAEDEENK